MLRVGLTGGIGSGKTTVARIFEILGIPVYYADDAAKRLMNENDLLREKIIRHFGEGTYTGGSLNRSHLSSLVFSSPGKLALLNSLVHPVTIEDAEQWMLLQSTRYAIKEAALVFETDAWKRLDLVIGVDAPYELRLQRSMQRDQLTRGQVEARMDRQMDEAEKMERCDFVVVNDEQQLLIPQVISLHEMLTEKAGMLL
jgi:dephospho-CoA kinase